VGADGDAPKAPQQDSGIGGDAEEAALHKGLEWLKGKQKGNGSWGDENYPAVTALALWAFAGSDHPEKAGICSNAAAFVAKFSQNDGGIYKPATGARGSGGLSVYNTAVCMTALHVYDAKKHSAIVLKAREFMAGGQLKGDSPAAGGFGYERTPPKPPSKDDLIKRMTERAEKEGNPPPTEEEIAKMLARMEQMAKQGRADLSNTDWASMAMRMTQDAEDLRPAGSARVDLDWSAMLKYLDKLQDKDQKDELNYGGFGYEMSGERGGITNTTDGAVKLRSFGSMTYAGLESMIYAQLDKSDSRVTSAIQWASRHWSVDENPGQGSKGLYYYYTIMAKALSLVGSDTIPAQKGEPIPWKKHLVAKLVQVQGKDGSWANSDNQFWEADPVLVTSYAVLVLEKCRTR
jgi:squalene-hopene/tetraprenyl-beta-curcumene cyclase